jgi:hypothetical protein
MTDNGTDHRNPRAILADWVDARVKVVGYLERVAQNRHPDRPYLYALIQDAEVEFPTRARHRLGHAYLQHGEVLKDIPVGSKIRCSVCVKTYFKASGNGRVQDYSLTFPDDVEVLPGPVFLPTVQEPQPAAPAPKPPPPAPTCNPLDAIIQVRDRVQQAGGVAAVVTLLDAVAGVGGWDAAAGVMSLAESVGDSDKLKQLLDFLKL